MGNIAAEFFCAICGHFGWHEWPLSPSHYSACRFDRAGVEIGHTIYCGRERQRTLRKNDKFVTCGGGVGVFSEPRSFGCAQDDPLPGVNFQSFR